MPLEGFNPTELDCEQWIRTIKEAGAKYAILVCKHHDGFANWPSKYTDYSVANKVYDYYEMDDINNPDIDNEISKRLFMKIKDYKEKMMPAGTTMVPRVFKTNVGDIFTTNTINAETLKVGDVLTPGAKGILEVGEGDMKWQVVKVYTMPDHQKGVKVMRIA